MSVRTPSPDGDSPLSANFDLSQIFIGREQQLDQFRFYLERWQRLAATSSHTQLNTAPSPNDKIQGFVVLLHGRGGFGKSVLLRCYHELAQEYRQELIVSKIVDWEFAAQEKRALFNPAPGERVEVSLYYHVLREQLSASLGKRSDDFKEYQSAVKAVEDAKKQASGVLNSLQREDRYSWIRSLASDGILELVRLAVPGSNIVLGNKEVADKIKEVTGEGVKIGMEQVKQVWSNLHDRLGSQLNDYLEPALRLGLGIGYDLAVFAKKRPLLIFFDTYEEVDEADNLLRIVMGAAGVSVGWILSGRDNLWAGLGQRLRSIETEYGYKDIVPPDRRLVIDFSADGVGDFTLSDIEEYFAQLCAIPHQPPLPAISEKDAAHIRDVTQGVPLAVKIAASLYLERADLRLLTTRPDGKREIVDQMVRRYLLHTRTNQGDRSKLYGLALLRRAEDFVAVAAALDLPSASSYEDELSRLHRRYGFVFTKQEQPSLHQEVRHFLRLWLLEHRTEPGIVTTNGRLEEAHLTALKQLEAHRQYTTLRERLEDDQWAGRYLDLAEQCFWLDPTEGVRYMLPFMFAAAIYRRDANREAKKIGEFFENAIAQPHCKQWIWAAQSLVFSTSRNPLPEELSGLEALVKLASQTSIAFSSPLPDFQEELTAALWWRLGEAYRGRNNYKASEWYEKALSKFSQEEELLEAVVETTVDIAHELDEEGKSDDRSLLLNNAHSLSSGRKSINGYGKHSGSELDERQQALTSFDREVELDPKSAWAYINRGREYAKLKEYQRAIVDFDHALELNPGQIWAYANRGIAYSELQEYRLALADFDRILELDSGYAWAYAKRGETYYQLNEYRRSVVDFDRALELEPKLTWVYTKRGEAYRHLSEHRLSIADFDRMLELNPGNALIYAKRGETYRVVNEYQRAIADFNRALEIDPKLAWVYAKLGEIYRLLTEQQHDAANTNITPESRRFSRRTALVGIAGLGFVAASSAVGWELAQRLSRSPQPRPHPPLPIGTLLYTYLNHTGTVHSVAWSLDNKRIASASSDGAVQVWSAFTGQVFFKLERDFGLEQMAWSPDDKYFALTGYLFSDTSDKGPRSVAEIWDTSLAHRLRVLHPPSDDIYAYAQVIAWSPQGYLVAIGMTDTGLQVWNALSGKQIVTGTNNFGIQSLAWSPDGTHITSAGYEGIQVWNVSSRKNVHTLDKAIGNAVAWSPDSKYIASASDDNMVQIWDVSKGVNNTIYSGHNGLINTLAWSRDSKYVASGSNDKTVQIWNAFTGKTIAVCHHTREVKMVAWSYDDKYIASASVDGTVRIWKAFN